jgi:transposase
VWSSPPPPGPTGVTAASVQDHDGARPLLCRLRLGGRGILLVWADAAYAGRLVTWARSTLRLRLVIVRRRLAHAFEVLPRRWVIERTFAWLSRYRRTVRDYEWLPAHHQAMVQWAMTIIMTRRLARRYRPRPHAHPSPGHSRMTPGPDSHLLTGSGPAAAPRMAAGPG